jgi:hydrogenase maturation protease
VSSDAARAVIVGIGQRAAGDDAVGILVAGVLAARGFETRACADASVVLALLEAGRRVVVVDAVVGGGPPGTVLRLDPGELSGAPAPLSSHGIGVAEAIELARTLYGERIVAAVAIVGVAIDRPLRAVVELSPAVAAAIEPAAALAAGLAAP